MEFNKCFQCTVLTRLFGQAVSFRTSGQMALTTKLPPDVCCKYGVSHLSYHNVLSLVRMDKDAFPFYR